MSQVIVLEMELTVLKRQKTLHIYLPSGYAESTKRYPVLYMHDGHNLFDLKTSAFRAIWDVHHSLDEIESRSGQNMIVVGIDCPSDQRFNEYSPWVNVHIHDAISYLSNDQYGGEGDCYLEWIVKDLKPYIDNQYRTDPDKNWMAGSSMGALISLYAACRYPNVFRKIGAFSPAVWFAESELLACIKTNLSSDTAVFLSIGTNETSDNSRPDFPLIYRFGARKIFASLQKKGIQNIKYIEYENGIHSERSWAVQFPDFARWLLEIIE